MAKKILFVDDEPDVLRVAGFRLKKAEYEVVTAINGQEAWELVQKIKPDLVLLDLRLPVMMGDEVCRKIKSDISLNHIPVILFTASVNNLKDIIKNSGADDFLTKPFDQEQLLAKIGKLIG